MSRRLLNFLALSSLLLLLSVGLLWVRSYLRTDTVCVVWGQELLYIESSRGALAGAWNTGPPSAEDVVQEAAAEGWAWHVSPGRDRYRGMNRTLGFAWYYRATPSGKTHRVLHVPDAALALAAALAPAVWAVRRRTERHRRRPGVCAA